MNSDIKVFVDSYSYDDTYEYDVDMDYYEDKVYDKFVSTYKKNPEYINFINTIDINNYDVTLRIERNYDDRFSEFEFYGIIQFKYKY